VGPRAGLDVVKKRKILSLLTEIKFTLAVSLQRKTFKGVFHNMKEKPVQLIWDGLR
jgi:hypothetical protein